MEMKLKMILAIAWRAVANIALIPTVPFVVPIALLFTNKDSKRLPKCFSWYDDYKYGINGDIYWQTDEHAGDKFNTYWWRLRWLLRNKLDTFQHVTLGVPYFTPEVITHRGAEEVSRFGKPGWMYIQMDDIPCFYMVKPWLSIPILKIGYDKGLTFNWVTYKLCLRVYIGWKLRGPFDSFRTYGIPTHDRSHLEFVFAVNPFMEYNDAIVE